jgi:translation initiation factor IF-3
MNKRDQRENRINTEIRSISVRIVGDNVENKVISTKEAISIAENLGLDLVEINGKNDPPICKIIDYQKFLYEKKKKEKENSKKQKNVETKEIRMTPNIDTHDINFKTKHITNFLKEGNNVKLAVFFSGREIIYKDKGEQLLLQLAADLEDIAIPDGLPRLEGKRMSITLRPKSK